MWGFDTNGNLYYINRTGEYYNVFIYTGEALGFDKIDHDDIIDIDMNDVKIKNMKITGRRVSLHKVAQDKIYRASEAYDSEDDRDQNYDNNNDDTEETYELEADSDYDQDDTSQYCLFHRKATYTTPSIQYISDELSYYEVEIRSMTHDIMFKTEIIGGVPLCYFIVYPHKLVVEQVGGTRREYTNDIIEYMISNP